METLEMKGKHVSEVIAQLAQSLAKPMYKPIMQTLPKTMHIHTKLATIVYCCYMPYVKSYPYNMP